MLMTIKFEKPPINEVVISTYFNPPIHGLRNEHIGLFWHSVRKDFPNVSQQHPVGRMDIPMGQEIFPMPRYWMIAADDINLIQIQKNAFMFNWRRREDEYPHYDNLKPVFDKHFSVFRDFILSETDTKDLRVDVCELTYINTIESCDYWYSSRDTGNVIPSFSILDIGVIPKVGPGYNCAFVYELADDLQLRVSIRNAQSTQDPEIMVLVLEIRASGRIGSANKSSIDSWFERGHQAIIDGFVRMTNPEIQKKYWLLKERSA
jgi:uncharacterized protein (TIGR04255 family)